MIEKIPTIRIACLKEYAITRSHCFYLITKNKQNISNHLMLNLFFYLFGLNLETIQVALIAYHDS